MAGLKSKKNEVNQKNQKIKENQRVWFFWLFDYLVVFAFILSRLYSFLYFVAFAQNRKWNYCHATYHHDIFVSFTLTFGKVGHMENFILFLHWKFFSTEQPTLELTYKVWDAKLAPSSSSSSSLRLGLSRSLGLPFSMSLGALLLLAPSSTYLSCPIDESGGPHPPGPSPHPTPRWG